MISVLLLKSNHETLYKKYGLSALHYERRTNIETE